MANVSKIFKPRRGKASTMAGTKASTVLANGEMFIEVPNKGSGSGHSKMKIGDGTTAYSSLPYAMGDTENDKITFSSNTSTTVATALNSVTSGGALKNLIAGLKQAVSLCNTSITKLNDDIVVNTTNIGDLDTRVTAVEVVSNAKSVDIASCNGVLSDQRRYIQGYESLILSTLFEFTDISVSSVTALHIDAIDVFINGTWVHVADQTITKVTAELGDNLYVNVTTNGRVSVSEIRNDSTTSKCIGGFHYGRIRTSSNSVTLGIIPNSVWTLKWQPACKSPNAMVYLGKNLWGDIYLTRVKRNTGANGIGGLVQDSSAYGSLPCTGTEGFNQYTFTEALAKVGKRLSFSEEFVWAAEGSPQGLDNSNTNAWTATSNSARTSCGAVQNAISNLNVVDMVGNVWKWNADKYELNLGDTSYVWHDIGGDRGDVFGPNSYGLGALISGGNWIDGSHCGSRCVSVIGYPWSVNANGGAWAVADMK